MSFPRYEVKIIGGKLHKIPITDQYGSQLAPARGPTTTTSRNHYTWPLQNSRQRFSSHSNTLAPLQEKHSLNDLALDDTKHKLSLSVATQLGNVSSRTLENMKKMFKRLDKDNSGRITRDELVQASWDHQVMLGKSTFDELLRMYELPTGGVLYKPLADFLIECHQVRANNTRVAGVPGFGFNRLTQIQGNTTFRDREDARFMLELERDMKLLSYKADLDALKEMLEGSPPLVKCRMMKACCDSAKLHLSSQVMDSLFDRCDINKDGSISWKEFLHYLNKVNPTTGTSTARTESSVALWESREPLADITPRKNQRQSRMSSLEMTGSRPRMVSGHTQTESDPQPDFIHVKGHKVPVYPPQEYLDSQPISDPPPVTPTLQWVYGYSGKSCRNNLFVLGSDELVYFIAGVVVVYDPHLHMQRHYLQHKGDVKSLAVHPNGVFVASGQGNSKKGGKGAVVHIWNSSTMETICVLGAGFFKKAVVALDFSRKKNAFEQGCYLAAVDNDDMHTISVWDWKKKKKITSVARHSEQIFGVTFSKDEDCFLSHGVGHLSFWFWDDDKTLYSTRARFEKNNRPSKIECVTYAKNGDVVTGDSNGYLSLWKEGENTASKSVRAYSGPVSAVCTGKYGEIISGCGTDRVVYVWTSLLTDACELKLPTEVKGVSSLVLGRDNILYIGTTSNTILKTPLIKWNFDLQSLIQGHADSVRTVSCHPKLKRFVTGGFDCSAQLWDSETFKMMWESFLMSPVQALCFHPEDDVIVAGCKDGSCHLLDASSGAILQEVRKRKKASGVSAVRFSPGGSLLAVSSEDKHLYVYKYKSENKSFEYGGRFQGHNNAVKSLDWSEKGEVIQSASDNELLYWDASKSKFDAIQPAEARDMPWASFTCKLGFPVLGLYDQKTESTSVQSVAASTKKQYLAAGDDQGQVNLYAYPCTHARAKATRGWGHSASVVCLSWLYDDSTLVSAGGKDSSIMQWRIQDASSVRDKDDEDEEEEDDDIDNDINDYA